MKKLFFKKLLLLIMVILLLTPPLVFSQNKYALIIFGRSISSRLHEHHQHELKPLYDMLVNQYGYDRNNIWVIDYEGTDGRTSWIDYFDNIPQNRFFKATNSNVTTVFGNINSILNINTNNQLLIFMPGHQGSDAPPDPHWEAYSLRYSRVKDDDFAQWVNSNLYKTNDAKANTKFVYFMGACCAWGFQDDLVPLGGTIYFASADRKLDAEGTIDTDPTSSFLKLWVQVMQENVGISFEDAYNEAGQLLGPANLWNNYTFYEPNLRLWRTYDWPCSTSTGGTWYYNWGLLGNQGTVLRAPEDFDVDADGYSDNALAILSWDDNSVNEGGFKVDRQTDDGSWVNDYSTRSANSQSFNEGVARSHTYTYRMRAINGDAKSLDTEDKQMPFYIWWNGPSYVPRQETGIWHARWVGGEYNTDNVTYLWKKNDVEVCITSTYSCWVPKYGNDFTLSLTITKGSESDGNEKTVSGTIYTEEPPKTTGISENEFTPTQYSLESNYPNPFNPATTITFNLPEQCKVKLTIHNIQGQKVSSLLNETMPIGRHSVKFNAVDLPSGIYFYKISAGNFQQINRMLYIK